MNRTSLKFEADCFYYTNIEKMDNKMIIPNEVIVDKIYFIKEQKVMLDRDLARALWSRCQKIERAGA